MTVASPLFDRGVLSCLGLRKLHRMGEVDVRALDGVDFTPHAGEPMATGGRSSASTGASCTSLQ